MSERKKILIEIGHPAQVHQFKYVYEELKAKSYDVLIAAKDKEISEYLLKAYDLNYVIIDKTKKGIVSKILNLPLVYLKMYRIISKFKPDMIMSRFSFQSSHLAKLMGIPHIGFTDTEHINLSDKLTVPFVDVKFTATSYFKDLGKNHFRYNGNIELFYLHPTRFKVDPSIIKELGLKKDERYAIIRFVSWDAHHDIGQAGFSHEFKKELVEKLSQHLRVFITSEAELPEEFQPYQISIKPERIHHALALADLYIGEGATMASEAACMGTPSMYINQLNMGYIEEEEEYGVLHSYRNLEGVLKKALEIVSKPEKRQEYKDNWKKFMSNKINVTSFVTWFVTNYPDSLDKIKADKSIIQDF